MEIIFFKMDKFDGLFNFLNPFKESLLSPKLIKTLIIPDNIMNILLLYIKYSYPYEYFLNINKNEEYEFNSEENNISEKDNSDSTPEEKEKHESIFSTSIKVSDTLMNMENNNKIFLFPGNNAFLPWFSYRINCLNRNDKNTGKCLKFPILNIIDYTDDIKKYTELFKTSKIKVETIKNNIYDSNLYKQLINETETYHDLKEILDKLILEDSNQTKMLTSYIKKIFYNNNISINENSEFFLIETIYSDNNSLKIYLEKVLNNLGNKNSLKTIEIMSVINESYASFCSFCLSPLLKCEGENHYYRGNIFKWISPKINYIRANILLIFFYHYIINKDLLIEKINNIKYKYSYFYISKIFINKFVNIIYIKEDGELKEYNNVYLSLNDYYEKYLMITERKPPVFDKEKIRIEFRNILEICIKVCI